MEQKIKNGIYRHYKGGIYEAVCTATHSETLEDMVVYRSVFNNGYWVRPLAMWEETVECDGKRTPRFSYIAADIQDMDGMRLFGTIEKIVETCLLFDTASDENPIAFCRKSTGEVIILPCELGADSDGDMEAEEILQLNKNELEQARLIAENPTEYVKLPEDGLLDEYAIMTDFAVRLPPLYREMLEGALQGKGAFRRFKETVANLKIKEDWYRYKDMRYRKAAREWCQTVGINRQGDFLGNGR